MFKEFDYVNTPINLKSKKNECVDLICILFKIDILPVPVIWDHFFIYKYIQNINILNKNDKIIYATNGLYLKANNDLKETNNFLIKNMNDDDELMKISGEGGSYCLPMLHDKSIQFGDSDIKLCIQFNCNITTPLLIKPPIKTKIICRYKENIQNNQLYNLIPLCQRIEIPPNVSKYEYTLQFDDVTKYFLFYCVDIEVMNIQLTFNEYEWMYTYDQLNMILPALHLNNFPHEDKYLYIPVAMGANMGVELKKLDVVNITFTFRENKGGYIYLLSEIKNTHTEMPKMDNWIIKRKSFEFYDGHNDNDIVINVTI